MGNEGSQPMKYGDTLENDISVCWKVTQEAGFVGREGHCSSSSNSKLYSFGGVILRHGILGDTNELLVYDAETSKWENVKGSGEVPPSRAGASMVGVNDKLYLFGGLNHEQGWLQQVYMFDTETLTWSLLETTGPAPSPRDKAASAVIGDKIYIFGGFGPQGMEDEDEIDGEEEEDEDDGGAQFGWFNDLFIFDTATNSWSHPVQMNTGAPSPRAASGMVAVGKHLVIFGGKDAEARKNDLYIFDTEERKWIQGLDKAVNGRQPEPRSFHAVTAIDSRVVVTGGRGIDNHHFDDIHIFDTETKEWMQPAVEGRKPAARGAHTATVVGNQLMLFGGSSNFNPETGCCENFYNDSFSIPIDDIVSGKSIPKAEADDKENVSFTSNVLVSEDTPLKVQNQQQTGSMETSQ